MATIAGYPPPVDGLDATFARLRHDAVRAAAGEDLGFGAVDAHFDPASLGEQAVLSEYLTAQQLLPGAVQDATRLEMGRTYEELDAGKVDRKRGSAATVREKKVAGVA